MILNGFAHLRYRRPSESTFFQMLTHLQKRELETALHNRIRDSQLKPVTLWAVLKNAASVFSMASLQAMGLTGLENPFARLVRPRWIARPSRLRRECGL
jgi:hypothetical protein